MYKRSIASVILGAMMPVARSNSLPFEASFDAPKSRTKGQKRAMRPKASGAAALKRAATKRKNINSK